MLDSVQPKSSVEDLLRGLLANARKARESGDAQAQQPLGAMTPVLVLTPLPAPPTGHKTRDAASV
jgi:hypothetical protein